MALINHATRELTAKVVYYGPGLCGKTTNLQFIYESLEEETRGPMLSLSTESDRTLFFDFLPLDLGEVKGFRVRVQLYTVPGQVFYEETRRRVLKGADGVVFVADSQRSMRDANRDSFAQLTEHLRSNGLDPAEVPLVLQYNKRDLKEVLSVDELDGDLNPGSVPFFESVASVGIGVEDTFRAVTRLVLKSLVSGGLEREERPAPRAVPEPAAAGDRAEDLFEEEFEEASPLGAQEGDDLFFGAGGDDAAALLNSEPFLAEAEADGAGLAEELFASDSRAGQAPSQRAADGGMGQPAAVVFSGPVRATPGVPVELELKIEGKLYKLKIVLELVGEV